jgi:peptidoglycan/LPS O-acetylase OafA/YrhL
MGTVVAQGFEPVVRKHMPELDSIRGVAILLVFLFHAFGSEMRPSLYHGMVRRFVQLTMLGWTGVNLFFVLSGFLITGILLDSRARPDYWRRFYARRAMRILPAYYLLLVLLPIAALIPTMPLKVGWRFVAFSAIYMSNISELFGVQLEYGPLWSLSVEEHFYIGWPWVVRWLSERGVALTAVGIILLSPAVRAITYSVGGAWNGSVRTWNSLDGLAMGALLMIAARSDLRGRIATRRFAYGGLILGLILLTLGLAHGILSEDSDMLGKALRTTVVNLFALSAVASVLLMGTSRYKRFVELKFR